MIEKIELRLFNVGHGLSCMIRECPTNYVILFDLGSDSNCSPLHEISKLGLRADQIYITHPHGDHISEIEKISDARYCPNQFYVQEYDWNDVASKEQKHLVPKIKELQRVKSRLPSASYSGEAEMKFWKFTPEKAKEIFGESKYINNSSLGIIYKWRGFKIAILGDLETDALKVFCETKEFADYAKDTDILIAPHHGHNSGFPELWTEKIGKPSVTLISVKENDPHVCAQYQTSNFAKGIQYLNTTRYSLTTRNDGSIKVTMFYNENARTWEFSCQN